MKPADLAARAHAIARERNIWVVWKWEFVVGDATAGVSDDVVAIVEQIVRS